mmetsp:Transcript_22837/g.70991  ORF Transcript_22837/g.70991 Transcript_22837/m.70991 type:complete len:335 (+) Transcript_22837:366-1370(+)
MASITKSKPAERISSKFPSSRKSCTRATSHAGLMPAILSRITSPLGRPTVPWRACTCLLTLLMHTSSRSTIVILPTPDLATASAAQDPTPPIPRTHTWARARAWRPSAPYVCSTPSNLARFTASMGQDASSLSSSPDVSAADPPTPAGAGAGRQHGQPSTRLTLIHGLEPCSLFLLGKSRTAARHIASPTGGAELYAAVRNIQLARRRPNPGVRTVRPMSTIPAGIAHSTPRRMTSEDGVIHTIPELCGPRGRACGPAEIPARRCNCPLTCDLPLLRRALCWPLHVLALAFKVVLPRLHSKFREHVMVPSARARSPLCPGTQKLPQHRRAHSST